MMDIVWLGHGSFELRLDSGEAILIDPWIEGNPKYPPGHSIKRADLILITHGHFDHGGGDVPSLVKQFGSQVIAIHEIALWLSGKGVSKTSGMNKGGTQHAGPVAVTMTDAVHSSSFNENGQIVYAGEAAGYVLTFTDGRSLYFAGDTAVFGDMALIAELYRPQLAILPIGDHYTMGPREAALACRLLQAKQVIPMHWGTFPALTGTPEQLAKLVPGTEVVRLEPGQPFSW